jgi:hypothetical protein
LPQLPPRGMTRLTRAWMVVLRLYPLLAGGLVVVRIVQLAIAS